MVTYFTVIHMWHPATLFTFNNCLVDFLCGNIEYIEKRVITDVTLECVHKHFVTRAHASFYFLHDNESMNDDKNDALYTSTPCLTRLGYILLITSHSLGYLLIYPPQIAAVMKPISFSSTYSPVSHTKSLGESREWNMVFQGIIWYRLKAF